MTDGPVELSGGQESDPPDLRRALLVVLLLLTDLDANLADGRGDRADLRLRLRAVSAVLSRIAERLEDDHGRG